MLILFACSLLWITVHVGIAGTTVRRALAGRIGDNGFRGAFSLLSVVAISLLIWSYVRIPKGADAALWQDPTWLAWLLVAAMALAFVLFAASVSAPNPTAIGGEKVIGQEVRGIGRITRHPMLWSFAIWAVVHVIGNGTLASLLFFGSFALTSLVGMPSIDRKIGARDPAAWHRLAQSTSIVPFAAIAQHRNRFAPRELVVPLVIGVVLFLVLLWLHPKLFGVSPFA